MTGRLKMGMLTRVWTGSCWVAASVVAAAAGGEGGPDCGWCRVLVWVRVRVRAVFLGLSSLFLWCSGLRGVVLVVVLLPAVCSFGFWYEFGVGFWVGVRFEVERDLLPEQRGHRCRVGEVPSVLPGSLGRLCGGQGAPCSLACGRSFGRGFADEVGGEGGVGR